MSFLKKTLNKLKFSEKEFDEIKKGIRRLFKEEIQSHKNKNFMEIGINNSTDEIHIFTGKFNLYLKKVLSKDGKILVKSIINLFNISKNNIDKNSDRIRWIIETADKIVKLNNNHLTKIDIFLKLYEDIILEDLRKFGIILYRVIDKNYLYLYNEEFNFELKDNGYYEFKINTHTSSSITKEKLDKINKTRDVVLGYWNNF